MHIKRFIGSLGHAFKGIRQTFKTQQNFRIQVFAGCIALMLAFLLEISHLERIIVLLLIGLVLVLELLNTALEQMADLIHPELHPLIGRAKDAAAAAVLVMSICALIIGALIFIPKITIWFEV